MSKLVLIIDDSPTARQLLIFALRGVPDVEVREAVDGMDGLRQLNADAFDLALVDVNMPVLDGLSLVGMVRDDSSLASVALVVITTEGDDEIRKRAVLAGADDYVTKPFKARTVREVVSKLLDRPARV